MQYKWRIYTKNSIKEHTCAINTLEVFSKIEDKFLKMRDIHGNTVVLYSNHGQLYITTCQSIKQIQIEQNEKCYEFVPVTLKVSDLNTTGYLTQDKII